MAEGPAPVDLLRRLEAACEGEPADQIVFCTGLLLGEMIRHLLPPEHHDEIVAACLDAIRVGIAGPPTEH